ncbi:MFS transporter [Roseospirillum parvum]|uniref:Predicted arabinose efflux permease, MFS family n=1 Tax=Roseospirillum parvum TaxID=83401 RepID=A0A1G8FM95_9PROT|nr:MFS transporter [Roseospirillum parvum]SDH83283.1 Predicted arabinose efflux permease, MFS family [Roseospirillum parvum]
MGQVLLSVVSLLVGTSVFLMGQGLLGTLVGLRMAGAGYADSVSGLVMAAYFLGLALAALNSARVIAIAGHIRAFAVFATCFSAATLAHSFHLDPTYWFVLRLIEGYCMCGLFMCVESWLNERSTNDTRGTVLSIYSITVYGAQGAAQFLLNLAPLDSFLLFALASILVSVALVPVALTRVPAPTPPTGARFGFLRLYRISPLGVFGCIMSGMVIGAFYGMAPVFGAKMGFSVNDVATLMAAVIIGGVVLQWPLGRFSDRFDRRLVIAGVGCGIAVAALCLAGVAWAAALMEPRTLVWAVIGLAALFGAFSFTLYPLALAQANDFIEPHELVPASGGLMLAYSFGAVGGPLAASLVMDAVGPAGLWAFIACGGVLTLCFSVWRMIRGAPLPETEDQGNYQMMARTTAAIAELDPRGEDDQLWFEFDYQAQTAAQSGMENPHAGDPPRQIWST